MGTDDFLVSTAISFSLSFCWWGLHEIGSRFEILIFFFGVSRTLKQLTIGLSIWQSLNPVVHRWRITVRAWSTVRPKATWSTRRTALSVRLAASTKSYSPIKTPGIVTRFFSSTKVYESITKFFPHPKETATSCNGRTIRSARQERDSSMLTRRRWASEAWWTATKDKWLMSIGPARWARLCGQDLLIGKASQWDWPIKSSPITGRSLAT